MAQILALLSHRQLLGAVLGPLTSEQASAVWTELLRADELLVGLSRHLGNETSSHLMVVPDGLPEIQGVTGGCVDGDGAKCVQFLVELMCGSFDSETGEWTDTPDWTIDATIEADCQHRVDHGGMDPVHDLPLERAADALEAARAFHRAVEEIVRLGYEKPLEHWLRLASDDAQTNDVD